MGDSRESVRLGKLARDRELEQRKNAPEIHRMVWAGKDAEDHPGQPSLQPGAGWCGWNACWQRLRPKNSEGLVYQKLRTACAKF